MAQPVCLSLYGKKGKALQVFILLESCPFCLHSSLYYFFFVSQWSVICGYLYWILASDSKFKEFWRFDCQIEICMFMKILYALTCICVFWNMEGILGLFCVEAHFCHGIFFFIYLTFQTELWDVNLELRVYISQFWLFFSNQVRIMKWKSRLPFLFYYSVGGLQYLCVIFWYVIFIVYIYFCIAYFYFFRGHRHFCSWNTNICPSIYNENDRENCSWQDAKHVLPGLLVL